MCQIGLVYALNAKLGDEGAAALLEMMSEGSSFNDDGWGVVGNDGTITKAPKEFKLEEHRDALVKALKGGTFALGHVRLATHGAHTDENTHPLRVKGVIVAHNGVIANEMALRAKFKMPQSPAVDSYVIPWLVHHFTKCNQGDIVKGIIATVDELRGSFSVFVYDTKSKRLFYFRRGSDFYFRLIEREGIYYVVGNTKRDNASAVFERGLFGFTVRGAATLSTLHPREDTLFELSDEGLAVVCGLPIPPPEKKTDEKTITVMSTGSYRKWLEENDVIPYAYDKTDAMSYGCRD